MKTCPKCSTEKPLEEFNKHSRNKDGRDYYCRECSSEMKRLSKIKNKKPKRLCSNIFF